MTACDARQFLLGSRRPCRPERLVVRFATCLLAWVLAPAWALAAGQPIHYLLDLRDPASHLVQVTMTVPGAGALTEIQFPAWNALYQIRDFVRNVQDLEARCDAQPQELFPVDLYTWRSGSKACSKLEIRYAVYANEEGVFSAVLNEHHSFMNLALLLFYLPRDRARSATLKFLLPEGWKLATLLEEGTAPDEYTAGNFDLLADSPAEAGEFREYQYEQGGALYRVVVDADPSDYSAKRLLASLQKITATETALMRDVPFRRYTFILHFPRKGRGGGMEHRNGTAISFPADNLRANWSGLESVVAHEFFHLWNVKRIRPQNLEPVDYVHGNDTRDLWFCEGVTNTYQELVLLRAGLISRKAFYARLANAIFLLQQRPARHTQSAELAGLDAWLEKYPDYLRPQRSISYYNKGELLGYLLDLAIRHASGNEHSLDDVMRRLNKDFAQRGRFFNEQDLLTVIADLAPGFGDLHSFFRDYVSGTRELDYARFLGFAGLRLVTTSREYADLGFLAVQNFDRPVEVESVKKGSNAENAGVRPGDILLEMNGRPLTSPPDAQLRRMKAGQPVRLRLSRDGRELTVQFTLEARTLTTYRIEEVEQPTPEQLRVRRGWLEGKTQPVAEAVER